MMDFFLGFGFGLFVLPVYGWIQKRAMIRRGTHPTHEIKQGVGGLKFWCAKCGYAISFSPETMLDKPEYLALFFGIPCNDRGR